MNALLGTALTSTLSLQQPAPAQTTGGSFSEAIGAAMNEVEGTQATAKQAATDLLVGGSGDVHTVALAAQRAELSLEMFQQVRNKFVQAYQEIMKMPM
jgi:flagellar hook-basal body complex protein FliE